MLTHTLQTLRAVGGLLFVLYCGVAAAASKDIPTQYHVEILLFAVNNPAAVTAEAWPNNFGISSTVQPIFVSFPQSELPATVAVPLPRSSAIGAQKPSVATPPYQFLSPDNFKLSTSFFKLKKAPQYETLLHTAWRQPAIDFKQDSAVYVFEGMNDPSRSTEIIPVTNGPITTPADLESGMGEAVDHEPHAPRFSGTLKLALGQYLHVALDLLYRRPVQRNDGVNAEGIDAQLQRTALQGFRIDNIRRIRLGEVHYFDHPVFGALVLVAPVEKSKYADVEKETVGADSPAPAVMPDD